MGKKDYAFLARKVGVPGMLIVFVIIFFFTFSTNQQKQEFIDLYILFKGDGIACYAPFAIFILLLLLITFSSAYFFNLKRKLFKMEIRKLRKMNDQLMTDYLNR